MFNKHESLYYKINKLSSNIAAFDLDYTLIKPKSGNKFPKNKDDWKFINDKVKLYLNALNNNSYSIVIFTNQKGISKGELTISDFHEKIKKINDELGFELNIFISTKDDMYRKPMTGMWDFMIKKSEVEVDYKNSFYVGDAAGRVYKKRKDHSSDDLFFANNVNVHFFTPEKFFNEEDEKHKVNKFNLKSNNKDFHLSIDHTKKNMILMVGAPASGKSYISKNYFKNYKIINQDKLRTKNKCLQKTVEYLNNNKNLIIDNTNPTISGRKEYLNLADDYDYNKIIINFNIPRNVVKYLNKYRVQTENSKLIPDIAYNIFYKKFEEPTNEEGHIIEYNNYMIDKKYKF